MSPSRVWKLYQTLSDDECANALRAVSEHGFRRYVSSRGVLREVLSDYTGVEPCRLRIDYGRSGKPYIPAIDGDDMRFSLSHAGELSVIAIAWGSDIGVDIVEVAPGDPAIAAWASQLAPETRVLADALPADERERAIARAWTRANAVLKATGRGRAFPMFRLPIPLDDDKPGRVMLDGAWNVYDIPCPDEGYVAALAVRSREPRIVSRSVSPPDTSVAEAADGD